MEDSWSKIRYNSSFRLLFKNSIGIYPIQLACLFFDHETPLDITCRGHMMATGVDECATIVLLFSRQRTATISVSTNCALYGKTILVGDRGIAEVTHIASDLILRLEYS